MQNRSTLRLPALAAYLTLALLFVLAGPTLAAALGLAPASRAQRSESTALPTTVIFVRHAETAASTRTERDPALSEVGLERAQALAHALASAEVTALYCSEFQRTRTTLAPLAEGLGLEVEPLSARDPAAQLAALRALEPGSVAVVAGHSNTVPALVAGLGGRVPDLVEDAQHGELLPHEAYDRLVIVTLDEPGAPARTLTLHYGQPTPTGTNAADAAENDNQVPDQDED